MNNEIVKSWRTIYAILKENGYVEMYQDEITTIVNFIKNNLEKEIPEKLEYEESDENGEFSINGFTFDFEQKIHELIDFLKQN